MVKLPSKQINCKTCLYGCGAEGDANDRGNCICKRYPGKVMSNVGESIVADWPIIIEPEDQWCGEWVCAKTGKKLMEKRFNG